MIALETPRGHSIDVTFYARSVQLRRAGGSPLRVNLDELFHKYEVNVESHTRSLLAKLAVERINANDWHLLGGGASWSIADGFASSVLVTRIAQKMANISDTYLICRFVSATLRLGSEALRSAAHITWQATTTIRVPPGPHTGAQISIGSSGVTAKPDISSTPPSSAV